MMDVEEKMKIIIEMLQDFDRRLLWIEEMMRRR